MFSTGHDIQSENESMFLNKRKRIINICGVYNKIVILKTMILNWKYNWKKSENTGSYKEKVPLL